MRAAHPEANPTRSARFKRGLMVSGGFLAAFVVLTVFVFGPLKQVDIALNSHRDISGIRPFLEIVDHIGQRAVCLPILGVVAFLACRKARSWRPAIVAVVAVFSINLVVGILKLSFERGSPLQGDPDLLDGGVLYPSGHMANVVLVYGLAAYLWGRYAEGSRLTRKRLYVIVAVLTLIMGATSLTLRWHWFSDLVGGTLIGLAVLKATTTIDRALLFTPVKGKTRSAQVSRPGPVQVRVRPVQNPRPASRLARRVSRQDAKPDARHRSGPRPVRYRETSLSGPRGSSAARPGPDSRG